MKKDLLKDILNEKTQIQVPRNLEQDFLQKFDNHIEMKRTKKRIFFGIKNITLTIASLCIFTIAFINYTAPSSNKTTTVSDYLSFVESNFKNDDIIIENIDEIDGLAYTNFYDDY